MSDRRTTLEVTVEEVEIDMPAETHRLINALVITRDQVEELRRRAAVAHRLDMVAICDRALDAIDDGFDDSGAIRMCAAALKGAAR